MRKVLFVIGYIFFYFFLLVWAAMPFVAISIGIGWLDDKAEDKYSDFVLWSTILLVVGVLLIEKYKPEKKD